MATRSFTVYRDAPSTSASSTRQPGLRPLGRSNSAAAVLASSRGAVGNAPSTSFPEKENVNPLTGLSLSSNSTKNGKKRKASESGTVLATKVLAAAPEPVQKPARVPLKRRSTSVQLASTKAKLKRDSSKKKDNCSSGQAPSLSISRSNSKGYLEPISEEPPSSPERPKAKSDSLTQAQIDSRCYDLTVSPLADVSSAFIQSPESSKEGKEGKEKEEEEEEILVEYRIVKDKTNFANKIRDYFSPEGTLSSSMSSFSSSSSKTPSLISFPSESSMKSSLFDSLDDFDLFTGNDKFSIVNPETPKKARPLGRCASLPCPPFTPESKMPEFPKVKEAPAALGPAMLSTPQRKELYALFTFSTPTSSPTKRLQRGD